MKSLEFGVFLRHSLQKQFLSGPPLSTELQCAAERQFSVQVLSKSFLFIPGFFPMKSTSHMNERVFSPKDVCLMKKNKKEKICRPPNVKCKIEY